MKCWIRPAATLAIIGAAALWAQQPSVTLDGKNVSVKFAGPAVKGQPVPVAAFHTDADIVFKGVPVSKGDYSLYVVPAGADKWQLAVNKATGAKAATYDPKLDAGRVAMTPGKASAAADAPRVALVKVAALAARVEVAWGATVVTAQFRLDRVAGDSEW